MSTIPIDRLMVVDVDTSGGFNASAPRVLFESEQEWAQADILGTIYDVTPDDQRFIIGRQISPFGETDEGQPRAILVNNFLEELKARVGR